LAQSYWNTGRNRKKDGAHNQDPHESLYHVAHFLTLFLQI
jgi:hypothetical protein